MKSLEISFKTIHMDQWTSSKLTSFLTEISHVRQINLGAIFDTQYLRNVSAKTGFLERKQVVSKTMVKLLPFSGYLALNFEKKLLQRTSKLRKLKMSLL